MTPRNGLLGVRAGMVKTGAVAFSLFALTSVANAQDTSSAGAAPHVAGLDSAQAASITACRQLQTYGKAATASSLKAMRQKGTLASSIDSANGALQRGGKYNAVVGGMLGLNTLPDSVQKLATTAGASCSAVPPIATFQQMVNTEMQKGPRVGIMMEPLTAQSAKTAGLADTTKGLLVKSVVAGMGAQEAGMVAGDVIVGVNGTPVATVPDIKKLSATWKDGEMIVLDLLRKGGTRETVKVKVTAKD